MKARPPPSAANATFSACFGSTPLSNRRLAEQWCGYPADVSLVVAIPFGVASAVVYGASIVVQHRTAQQHADGDGEASAAGLLRLVRSPTWLLAIVGDFVGFVLQVVALSAGPVVFIQPLVVLMLPVSLGVSFVLGGHRPRVGDYLGVIGVLGGLGVFLALIGQPAAGHVPRPRILCMAIVLVLVVGAVLCVVVTARHRVIRGAMYGAVAGAYFGALAVMVDAASDRASRAGVHGLLDSPRGLVPLIGVAVLGLCGIVLTQMSFQVGALGATLPANLAVDPLVGVLLGVVLLHEHVPHTTAHLVAYALCLTAVVAGAIRLADPTSGPIEPDARPAAPTASGETLT
jgi:drug/metabolite transporter (DMT)-like permease